MLGTNTAALTDMPKYVAFLRAINVGGHIVRMDRLRGLFEAIGFSRVETFINSGNVIFDSPSRSAKTLEAKIAAHLHEGLGYAVATFIRSPAELAAIARYKPFDGPELLEGHGLYVGFLPDTPTAGAKRTLLSFATALDDFHVKGREVYWLCRGKFGESKFSGARLERTLGMAATLRNSTTVRRIASKYA
jgi:uncharacterized protein (DUF1697 family)